MKSKIVLFILIASTAVTSSIAMDYEQTKVSDKKGIKPPILTPSTKLENFGKFVQILTTIIYARAK